MAWLLVSFQILYRHQSNFETILWINLFDYNYRRVHKGLRIATKESTEKKRLKRNGFDQTNFGMAFFIYGSDTANQLKNITCIGLQGLSDFLSIDLNSLFRKMLYTKKPKIIIFWA